MVSRTVATAIFCAAALLVPSALSAQNPRPSDDPPAEARIFPYSGELPACDEALALAEIARRFSDRERDYWNSPLTLDTFLAIRETGFRTRGQSFIPRRHCEASALFSDGATRRVVYSIGEGLGFVGFGWGLDWCVVGLDRNQAYAPACAGAGP
jgi:hypothetical protein